jgi:hypothetical protein
MTWTVVDPPAAREWILRSPVDGDQSSERTYPISNRILCRDARTSVYVLICIGSPHGPVVACFNLRHTCQGLPGSQPIVFPSLSSTRPEIPPTFSLTHHACQLQSHLGVNTSSPQRRVTRNASALPRSESPTDRDKWDRPAERNLILFRSQ